MSDDPEEPFEESVASDADSSVSLDEPFASRLAQFINSKVVAPNDECLVCAHPQNFIQQYAYRIETRKEPVILGGRYMPLFATVCDNCGFVRLFSQNVIERRIAEEDAAQAPEKARLEGDQDG